MIDKLCNNIAILFHNGVNIFIDREEMSETLGPPKQVAFISYSPEADLFNRTAMNEGLVEEIMIGLSCTKILLPVAAVANGHEIS